MAVALTTAAAPVSAEPAALPEVTPEYFKEAAALPVDYKDGNYIVQLAADPIATYEATAPAEGETIDFGASAVQDYRETLADEREAVIAEYDVDATAEYDTVLNGFAANLTAAEAEELAASDEVAAVVPETIYQPTGAVDTSGFLGLSGGNGSWEEEFGGPKDAGEGVIVGVLDTGIWPENPALAPLSEPRPDQDVIDAKWNGECVTGVDEDPANNVECNNKLIGARYFDTWGYAEDGFASPRDQDGHGTHTATTAAGNYKTRVEIDGEKIGTFSGMAPAARVAAYKVCWGGCPGADLVAGIEAAVNDGVDVINFSIGSTGTPEFVDSVSLAFFNAAAAGVFVAASAGNDGPTSTVDHQEPWVTTVAASTHDQTFRTEVEFGREEIPAAALVGEAKWYVKNAVDAAYDGTDPEAAARCDAGTLDPAKAEGFAIVCVRGNLFSANADQVHAAGGVALIVRDQYERGPAATVTSQAVPVVHVNYEDGLALAEWVDSKSNPRIEVETSELDYQNAPSMAAFSSNGPALAAEQNLLKPDITAPGVEILAGITPFNHAGNDFASNQGTSMSSPHIAGLAALLKSAHPEWSPMAVKSAIMTTAYQTDQDGDPIQRGGADATPFDYGAGHVDGQAMFDPGLVYESNPTEWIQYICGTPEASKVQSYCDALGAIDPSQLNYPSITVAELTGSYQVTRTVTNVSEKKSTYKAEITAPAGFEVSSDVTKFTLKPGESATYTLTITRTDAAFDEWAFGDVTWVEKKGTRTVHEVRSPIVVKPVQLAAADEASFTGASGSATLSGTSGFDGSLGASVSGLVASEVKTASLSDPDSSTFPSEAPVESSHAVSYEFTTPEDAALVRFSTFDADHPAGTDLDLFVYTKDADGTLTLVGNSASGGSNETVSLPGGYTFVVFVDEWAGPSPLDAKLHAWVVPAADAGNLAVDPAEQTVAMGDEYSVGLTWSGLAEGQRFLGTVNYAADGSAIDSTIVSIAT
ncbi:MULTISPECIES: S8 family serine peptidase [Glycomyces]|uniref:S8 family serine peptidase n=2 Tax=Glycomyces TaxID=58113 RepID=A0A9X3PG09_9ACTN|nr:S8 family serine peptidase [Glycomyces lechevalierae]MDA1384282.1 S8 family serine peptidase [Glycomyces lechevalierae]MDR7339287.1 subtilisin family serine protease [Glycomyces lechevalierae]